jgi:urease accessory protein
VKQCHGACRRPAALLAALALLPMPAAAHLVTTGLGPVYDGITHFLLSLEDLLPVIALALLAGLGGPVDGRRALFVLPPAWMVGGIAGFAIGTPMMGGGATAMSALVLGALVAADRRWHPAVVPGLAALLGLLHGGLNGAGIAAANREALALAGIGAALFAVVALLAALVVSLGAPWQRVAVRVAGAGLLLFGGNLRP